MHMKASIRLKFDIVIEPVNVEGTDPDTLKLPTELTDTLGQLVTMFAKLAGNTISESESVGGSMEVMARPYRPDTPSVPTPTTGTVN